MAYVIPHGWKRRFAYQPVMPGDRVAEGQGFRDATENEHWRQSGDLGCVIYRLPEDKIPASLFPVPTGYRRVRKGVVQEGDLKYIPTTGVFVLVESRVYGRPVEDFNCIARLKGPRRVKVKVLRELYRKGHSG